MSDEPAPAHRRTVQVDSHHEGDTLRVVGRLRDERPWRRDHPVLHDMELRLRVGLPDLGIIEAEALMHAFPHQECPFIAPTFAQMRGLSVTSGLTRALRELFAGVSGCAHLHELARATGPAVFQASASLRARERDAGDLAGQDPEQIFRALRGTCHLWAPDGVGAQKLAAGWRPGGREYPAPPLDRVLAESRQDGAFQSPGARRRPASSARPSRKAPIPPELG